MTANEVRRALDLVEARRMSWWDALLLASAISAGCTHFLTEDAQGAPVIDGVMIVDPFVVAPESVLGKG
jgi:predicted nucleic acid-binding protein